MGVYVLEYGGEVLAIRDGRLEVRKKRRRSKKGRKVRFPPLGGRREGFLHHAFTLDRRQGHSSIPTGLKVREARCDQLID